MHMRTIGNYTQFQGVLDRGLNKDDASKVVPWSDSPPAWAQGFRPLRILDIGCAAGFHTAAVLTRLAEWDVLSELRELVLIEREADAGRAAVDRCIKILKPTGISCRVRLSKDATIENNKLLADGTPIGQFDLIIASHVSYYFGENGAENLVEAALESLAPSNGYLWLVLRKRSSPVYQERLRVLKLEGKKDDSRNDYAENAKTAISRILPPAEIIDVMNCGYLDESTPRRQRERLSSLLMWRQQVKHPFSAALADQKGPIYIEQNLIVQRAGKLKARTTQCTSAGLPDRKPARE
jgi:SAM-dependent methyltransferase